MYTITKVYIQKTLIKYTCGLFFVFFFKKITKKALLFSSYDTIQKETVPNCFIEKLGLDRGGFSSKYMLFSSMFLYCISCNSYQNKSGIYLLFSRKSLLTFTEPGNVFAQQSVQPQRPTPRGLALITV